MKANRPQNRTCEQQARFIQERISTVEKHFAELCTSFAAYTRKASRLRDKGDELSQTVQSYAEAESVNRSLKTGLLSFSAVMAAIGDYRDAHVQRLEAKVAGELGQYDALCRRVRQEVKEALAVRDRELARRRQLDRLRQRNPHNRHQISLAESELLKASADVSRTVKALEEQTSAFERRKLRDARTVLLDFITAEMSLHAKELELFTAAYRDVAAVNEDADLQEFQAAMRVPETLARLDTVKRMSLRDSTSFLANLFSTPTPPARLARSPPAVGVSETRPRLRCGRRLLRHVRGDAA
ncbi:CBY1-interacting BAR domain-containing protein 1 isoform X2 [Bacillus rossius redtenbacheri]|uniref:CBY1-interacting BAR domain-containing protein 1 isoform X2 n=1 Tax=Bacillus rossius redtenbacheri TaxID=93214 RepID=UPI002FDD663C